MRPQILILSGAFDFSTDLVVLRLRELEVRYLRLNREHMKEYRFAMDPIGQTMNIRGPGINAEVCSNLVSVWYRQPIFLRNTPAKPLSVNEQLERSQWNAFMRAISVFDQAAWMNFPQATYLAECKPYQLITAFRCGFKIPETIVGNDVESIKNRFKKKMVLKSLDTILLREGDDCLFTYTTINEPERFNDDLIYSAPLLAQELLSEKTDIRVTLVGNEIFSVRILSRGKPIAGDWRTEPRAVLEYQDFQLPRDVEMACRNLSIRLGLSFSAIDLIETPEGIFFIEVNPTGEWGWISNDRRRIDKAIATWLTQPKSL